MVLCFHIVLWRQGSWCEQMRRQSRNIMTPTYAGPFRNYWALLLYGLDSVQISTIYSKAKHKVMDWIYLQAPLQCRVPLCPGLCIGRCRRGRDGRPLLFAADPAPEYYWSDILPTAGFERIIVPSYFLLACLHLVNQAPLFQSCRPR